MLTSNIVKGRLMTMSTRNVSLMTNKTRISTQLGKIDGTFDGVGQIVKRNVEVQKS